MKEKEKVDGPTAALLETEVKNIYSYRFTYERMELRRNKTF